MSIGKFDALGPALAAIGEKAMEVIGGEPDGVYLYVEAGDDWVSPSLYRDEGAAVKYFDSVDSGICDLIDDARDLEPTDKRWSGMEYTIDGGKFDVKFQFDDVERGYDGSLDRRQRFLHARYGDKPVVYPPMPSGSMEYRPGS